MDAHELLTDLCTSIDEHRWDDLPGLLHEDFVCRFVHTGEELDKDGWVRLNAEYPGFERMVLEDLVATGDRAVARCTVTGRVDGEVERFAVASFVTVREGLIGELTEVWTDVGVEVPTERRLPAEG